MMYKTMNKVPIPDHDVRNTKPAVNCNTAKIGETRAEVFIPALKKHSKLDIHLDTNVTIPSNKKGRFLAQCSFIVSIFAILFLLLTVGYQHTLLCVMQQNIEILDQQVEILALRSDSLSRSLLLLSDKVNDLMLRHHQISARDVTPEREDDDYSEDLAEDSKSSETQNILESDLSLLESVRISNFSSSYENASKLGNTTNMINTSLDSNAKTFDSESVLTDSPCCNNSVQFLNLFDNNETTDRLQQLSLDISSEGNFSDDSMEIFHEPTAKSSALNKADITGDEPVRTGRAKRSNRRGKQKSSERQRGRPTKKNKRSGPSVVHLKGGLPETFIEDGGSLIAPWYVDEQASGDFPLNKYELREGKGAIEVTEKGLYYIYAQVYYLTSEPSNSFSIVLKEEGKPSLEELALCSVVSASRDTTSEVSCFTSVVRFLNATNRIYLRQRERNRRMILRDGFSFFGLVHLNGINPKRG